MFLINTEIEVNWYLLTGVAAPPVADLDIHIVDPDGVSTYYESAINPADYTPSTVDTKGVATYRFTPNKKGLWKITLSNGTSDLNTEYHTYKIMVNINNTFTQKFVRSSLL